MQRTLLFVVIAAGIGLLYGIFTYTGREGFQVSKLVGRALSGRDLHLPMDAFKTEKQSEVVAEYQNRGYKIRCYGNLRKEQKIHPSDDYVCWTPLKTAMDNIAANELRLTFSNGVLTTARLELPESSFDSTQNYLAKRMAGNPRLDKMPFFNVGTDAFGKPLMAWIVPDGVLITSMQSTKDKTVILLWESKQSFVCRSGGGASRNPACKSTDPSV